MCGQAPLTLYGEQWGAGRRGIDKQTSLAMYSSLSLEAWISLSTLLPSVPKDTLSSTRHHQRSHRNTSFPHCQA